MNKLVKILAIICLGCNLALANPFAEELIKTANTLSKTKSDRLAALNELHEYTDLAPNFIDKNHIKALVVGARATSDKDIRKKYFEVANSTFHLTTLLEYTNILAGKEKLQFKYDTLLALEKFTIASNYMQEELYVKLLVSIRNSLINFLSYKYTQFRFQSAKVIAARKVYGAIPHLIERLGNDVKEVKQVSAAALVELNALKQTQECAQLHAGKEQGKWCASIYNKVRYNIQIAQADKKAEDYFKQFIAINKNNDSQQIQDNINLLNESMQNGGPYLDLVHQLSLNFYKNLPEKLGLDDIAAKMCSTGVTIVNQYPKSLVNNNELSFLIDEYKECVDYQVLSQFNLVEFYLTKAQRRKNPASVKTALLIMAQVAKSFPKRMESTNAKMLLLETYYYNNKLEEAKTIIKQLKEIEETLSSSQKNIINKIEGKL